MSSRLVELHLEPQISIRSCMSVWVCFWSSLTLTSVLFSHLWSVRMIIFCSNGQRSIDLIQMQECFMVHELESLNSVLMILLINMIPCVYAKCDYVLSFRMSWLCCVFDWTRIFTVIKEHQSTIWLHSLVVFCWSLFKWNE